MFHWSAQRHPSGEDNRPGGARLQYAEHWHSPDARQHARLGQGPDAWQQLKACATRMHALSGPCTRSATAFVHRICPATLSDISLRRRQPAWRRPSQAQCSTGRPSDTQAVKTTGQAEHACSLPSSGTAPTHGNNPRPARLGCTPSTAPAFVAPQPSATTQGLRDSDARPQRPLHSWRHSLRPPDRPSDAQRHFTAAETTDPAEIISGTVFLRSAQRHPGGENNRPGGAHLQYAELGHSPDARQLPKACATRMHALSGLCT